MMELVERFKFWRRVKNQDAPIWLHWTGEEMKAERYSIFSDVVTVIYHNPTGHKNPRKILKRAEFLSMRASCKDVNPMRRWVF